MLPVKNLRLLPSLVKLDNDVGVNQKVILVGTNESNLQDQLTFNKQRKELCVPISAEN